MKKFLSVLVSKLAKQAQTKRIFACAVSIILAISLSSCTVAKACNGYTYMRLTKISATEDLTEYDTEFDDYVILITSIDTNGEAWQWYSDDISWQVGDYVILYIIDTNNDTVSTGNMVDDIVDSVSYVDNINL